MKRFLMLLALPLLLGAASPSVTPKPSPALIHASHAWIRYLLPGLPAAGYMTLTNTGDATTRLVKASSVDCDTLMLHESKTESGTAMMTMVKSITIPSHGRVRLAEGGYHLMCTNPKMTVGGNVSITLSFSDGSNLLLLVPVYGPAGPHEG